MIRRSISTARWEAVRSPVPRKPSAQKHSTRSPSPGLRELSAERALACLSPIAKNWSGDYACGHSRAAPPISPTHSRCRCSAAMAKTTPGRFFEDFRLGEVIRHATPRTVTTGDVALYTALYGSRFAVQSSDAFARAIGYPAAPLDDLLVFHVVFGKTVPDISLNAVANLGYAEGRFGVPVFPGDTLSATSTVIGLKENSNRQTGVVYVRSIGTNQRGETV